MSEGDGAQALLQVDHLRQHFPVREGIVFRHQVASVKAVDDVSFTLHEGETVGLVGESGCGKTTLARTLMRLLAPTGGRIRFDGQDITSAGRKALQPLRRDMQMVFQDPFASLNPRKTVRQVVSAPLRLHGSSREEAEGRVDDLLARVGLAPEHARRFPHEFSGGQRQRIGVARALALEPRLIVLDEPVSALDVSVQAQVLNLLADLQQESGMAYLFVSHDLSVVRQVADQVAVMYLGKIVESGPAARVYDDPRHPYTRSLLASVPVPDPVGRETRRRVPLGGDVPSPVDPPSGCRFRTRCPIAAIRCVEEEPLLRPVAGGHTACHFADDVAGLAQVSR